MIAIREIIGLKNPQYLRNRTADDGRVAYIQKRCAKSVEKPFTRKETNNIRSSSFHQSGKLVAIINIS